MPDEAQRWFDRSAEIDPEHPMSKAAPLFMYYHTRENPEEKRRLARELLEEGIENRRGARFIALQTLYAHSLENDDLDSFLEVLDNLYPHLFDEPPHSFDRSWLGVYYVGMALLTTATAERGSRCSFKQEQDRREGFEMPIRVSACPALIPTCSWRSRRRAADGDAFRHTCTADDLTTTAQARRHIRSDT